VAQAHIAVVALLALQLVAQLVALLVVFHPRRLCLAPPEGCRLPRLKNRSPIR
tara:strand:- start:211 stop:369 length:159 start_codon:yes stop_codon:yes gene_type:complete